MDIQSRTPTKREREFESLRGTFTRALPEPQREESLRGYRLAQHPEPHSEQA